MQIEQTNTSELAQRMKQKLETLDSKFKVHHCARIDLIDDKETEQDTLDEHDEDISILAVRIKQLIASCATPLESGPRKITSRKLSHVKKDLSSIHVRDLLRCHTTRTSGVCELHAQASKSSVADHSKRPPKTEGSFNKRPSMSSKSVASFTSGATDPVASGCVLCRTDKHPLYTCPKFIIDT